MKSMLLAFLAIIVIAVAADFALDHVGFSTASRTVGDAVRVD